MPTCYHCPEEIYFINNGFGPIPIHPSGSCSGRGGGYGGGQGSSSYRSTSSGDFFEFPFVTYPSYVNPNARCPVCGCSVYFYQSPYGGRVFFDELGPPWRKHPCTDNPVVRQHFSTAEGRARILIGAPPQPSELDSETGEHKEPATVASLAVGSPPRLTAWAEAGWMPFVVEKILPRPIGIEAEGKLFVSGKSLHIPFRIIQTSTDARYYRTQGQLHIGSDLIQNVSRIWSMLNECPILLRKNPDLQNLTLSSFVLTPSGEVQEITFTVSGAEISQVLV